MIHSQFDNAVIRKSKAFYEYIDNLTGQYIRTALDPMALCLVSFHPPFILTNRKCPHQGNVRATRDIFPKASKLERVMSSLCKYYQAWLAADWNKLGSHSSPIFDARGSIICSKPQFSMRRSLVRLQIWQISLFSSTSGMVGEVSNQPSPILFEILGDSTFEKHDKAGLDTTARTSISRRTGVFSEVVWSCFFYSFS